MCYEKKKNEKKKIYIYKKNKVHEKSAGNPIAHARTQGFNITNIKARECTSCSQLPVKRPH
jgi:hypothetical protein